EDAPLQGVEFGDRPAPPRHGQPGSQGAGRAFRGKNRVRVRGPCRRPGRLARLRPAASEERAPRGSADAAREDWRFDGVNVSRFPAAAARAFVLGAFPTFAAGPPKPATLMHVVAAADPASVAAGGAFTLRLDATLDDGWHVNAHPPSEDYLIATEAKIA